MGGKDQRGIGDPVHHIRGPRVGQGGLLEVREALARHFRAKFRKLKLQSTNYLVGLVRSDRAWNFTQVSYGQSMARGRFCSRGLKFDGSQT
jgi:hypothetical protein